MASFYSNTHRNTRCALIFLLCVLTTSQSWAGDLARVRGEVREPANASVASSETDKRKKKRSDDERRRRDRQGHCDDDESLFEAIFDDITGDFFKAAAIGVVATGASPYWYPKKKLQDSYSDVTNLRYDPFDSERFGFMVINQPELGGELWTGQLSVDQSTDFDDLQSIGGDVIFEHRSRYGVDARWRTLTEDLGNSEDHLALGSVNATFRFAQSERLAFRSGLGFAWLADDGGSEFGINWIYSAEWTPAKPWVFRGAIELGKLGDAFAQRAMLRAGLHRGHWQVYMGPEYYGFDGTGLTLFTSGVSFRF